MNTIKRQMKFLLRKLSIYSQTLTPVTADSGLSFYFFALGQCSILQYFSSFIRIKKYYVICLGVSTHGYGFWPTINFVNLCQRLSTRILVLICLVTNVLGFVHNINRKIDAFYIS